MKSITNVVLIIGALVLCIDGRSLVESVTNTKNNSAHLKLSTSAVQGPLLAYLDTSASLRSHGYEHSVSNLKTIASALDAIIYGPFRFDDETFEIELDPTIDYQSDFASLAALQRDNTNMKVLISVGGRTFPSSAWSKAASSQSNRAMLVNSIMSLLQTYNLDGVEFDWDYPCSPKKVIYITRDPYTNEGFAEIDDTGIYNDGTCSDEIDHLGNLTSELRSAVGEDKTLIMALAKKSEAYTNILNRVESYVDHFTLKAYGYHVASDAYGTSSDITAPYQAVLSETGVQSTVTAFARLVGFSAAKTVIVMPGKGVAYSFQPGRDVEWQHYGAAAIKSGCNGPYVNTYSSYISDANQECGQMTYKEILNRYNEEHSELKSFVTDKDSDSELTFLFSKSLLISFSGAKTAASLASLVTNQRLGGIALDSIDMDSTNVTGYDDYLLARSLCEAFRGAGNSRCTHSAPLTTTPSPNSGKGCNHVDRTSGTYCANSTSFIICPNNVTEQCPFGTVCKQNEQHAIACDWPDVLRL